jgi:hypothetical protein
VLHQPHFYIRIALASVRADRRVAVYYGTVRTTLSGALRSAMYSSGYYPLVTPKQEQIYPKWGMRFLIQEA